MKKQNKIFIACDSPNISKVKKIINKTSNTELRIGYKFGLEFLNPKNGRKFVSQLKNKIIKVIIIVLIVKFFEKILKYSESFSSTTDILYFGLSILSICVGYYLLNRK